MTQEHNKEVLRTLEVGDLVTFDRGAFFHWGVYIGDGYVVHLTPTDVKGTLVDSSASNSLTNSENGIQNGHVKQEKLLDVAGDSKVEKNNNKDSIKPSLPREEIKKRASESLGPRSYNVLTKNCEHFASWCRNDIEQSQQVDSSKNVGGVALRVLGGVGGLVYKAKTYGNDSNMQNEIQLRPAKPWGGVDLGILVDAGKLLYAAVTVGNDRRLTSNSAMWNNFAHIADATRIGIHESGKFCMDMGCRTGTCVFKASANGMNWPK